MRGLRRFLTHWQNWLGLLLAFSFITVALAAPILSPPDSKTQGGIKKVGRSTDYVPHPPSETSILGTLPGQVDVFHALVWGARDALQFGLMVAIGTYLFGTFVGAIAGFAGGVINSFLMRATDAFLAFPALAGVIFLQQLVAVTIESLGGIYWFNNDYLGKVVYFEFTPPAFAAFLMKVDPILVSLILFSWMPIARIVNTLVISLKNTDFIQAARALGGGPVWIIRHHLLPNAVGPAIVLAARDVGSSVVLQATITFLGLGGASPWGILLSMGRNWVIGPGGDLLSTWWAYLPAMLAVILFGTCWNLLGEGLSDALDPSVSPPTGITIRWLNWKKFHVESRGLESVPAIHRTGNPEMITKPSSSINAGGPPELDPLLLAAQDALKTNDLERALHAYSHLIEHNRQVNVVVRDLAQVACQFPRLPVVWKLLGDALARSGNHEYANKSYQHYRNLIH